VLSKFVSGLVIGLGFSVSFVVVVSLWFFLIVPNFTSSQHVTELGASTAMSVENAYPNVDNFIDLPVEEKIEKSTAIIVTKITKNEHGIYQAIVSEILKQKDGVELYYKVGDIYNDHANYNEYERNKSFIPEGFIVFMSGNPATMRYSTSYSGEGRIGSLGDLPMKLFREKCEKPGT
jgi:hypothetical protein